MSYLQSAVLGIVQGLAEFLPVSSSGHLNLIQALFGIQLENQLLFNVLLHVGTLLAVLLVFWRDFLDMILHPVKNNTLLMLFIASLPALAAKLLLGDWLDAMETDIRYLGLFFLITGLLLILTQAISDRRQKKHIPEKDKVGVVEALVMGCMQAVGMLPGISRSGSTIFGGVSAKLNREKTAKFSFMMSAPAIAASMLSEGKDALEAGFTFGSDLPAILLGVALAFITGYLGIRFFMKVIGKHSLYGFALYVILLGIAVIVMLSLGIIGAAPAETAATAALTVLHG